MRTCRKTRGGGRNHCGDRLRCRRRECHVRAGQGSQDGLSVSKSRRESGEKRAPSGGVCRCSKECGDDERATSDREKHPLALTELEECGPDGVGRPGEGGKQGRRRRGENAAWRGDELLVAAEHAERQDAAARAAERPGERVKRKAHKLLRAHAEETGM